MKTILMILLSLCMAVYAEDYDTQFNDDENTSQAIIDTIHGPMMGHSMSCNIDIDFLRDIIQQYQGAIFGSRLYLDTSSNEALRKIANNIIATQEDEVVKYDEFANSLKEENSSCDDATYQEFQTKNEEIINTMLQNIENIQIKDDIDKDFANGIIENHQGVINSANLILKYTKNEKIQDIAKNIISTHEQNIKDLKDAINNSNPTEEDLEEE